MPDKDLTRGCSGNLCPELESHLTRGPNSQNSSILGPYPTHAWVEVLGYKPLKKDLVISPYAQ
jgi:hypothetical protein